MKLFNLHIITDKEYLNNLEAHYQTGIRNGWDEAREHYRKTIAETATFNYNEGKAYGVEQAKRAFTEALKQKGESNNDILRPNQGA